LTRDATDPILPPVTAHLRPWLLIGLIATCSAVQAAPEQPDALLQMLRDRGLVAAESMGRAAHRVRDAAGQLVLAAMNFIDIPYQRGGNDADTGFDCSGFTRHVFDTTLGLQLPRRADEQAHDDKLHEVPRAALQPGDLVFFNTMKRTFSHVGIYIGEGRFIHAPRTGARVRIEDMTTRYWSRRFDGARRAVAEGMADPPSAR